MRKFLVQVIFIALAAVPLAQAQFGPNWSSATPPENGACFYEKANFKGEYFCLDANTAWDELNKTFDHKVSSVRVIGKANVKAYSRRNFQGDSILIADRTPSLKQVVQNGVKWNDRIASVQVVAAPDRVAQRRHVRPVNGVCFYTDREYEGRELCVGAGANFPTLPKDFNKKIASLRTYGEVDLQLYSKPDFRGAHTSVSTRVRDMRELTRDTEGFYDWNKRIASVEVRLRPTAETAKNRARGDSGTGNAVH